MKYIITKPDAIGRTVEFINSLECDAEFFHQFIDICITCVASGNYDDVVHFLKNFENISSQFKIPNVPDVGHA